MATVQKKRYDLSIASTWDIQTESNWPAPAAETVSNFKTFLVLEAGHKSIAYPTNLADLTLAFLHDPMHEPGDACPQSERPRCVIP